MSKQRWDYYTTYDQDAEIDGKSLLEELELDDYPTSVANAVFQTAQLVGDIRKQKVYRITVEEL